MLVSSVRYAMGRRSYIVGQTCDMVRRYRDYLKPTEIQVIARDIGEELDRAKRMNETLGMEMDHKEWVKLLEELTHA
jgi:hypothetical protein